MSSPTRRLLEVKDETTGKVLFYFDLDTGEKVDTKNDSDKVEASCGERQYNKTYGKCDDFLTDTSGNKYYVKGNTVTVTDSSGNVIKTFDKNKIFASCDGLSLFWHSKKNDKYNRLDLGKSKTIGDMKLDRDTKLIDALNDPWESRDFTNVDEYFDLKHFSDDAEFRELDYNYDLDTWNDSDIKEFCDLLKEQNYIVENHDGTASQFILDYSRLSSSTLAICEFIFDKNDTKGSEWRALIDSTDRNVLLGVIDAEGRSSIEPLSMKHFVANLITNFVSDPKMLDDVAALLDFGQQKGNDKYLSKIYDNKLKQLKQADKRYWYQKLTKVGKNKLENLKDLQKVSKHLKKIPLVSAVIEGVVNSTYYSNFIKSVQLASKDSSYSSSEIVGAMGLFAAVTMINVGFGWQKALLAEIFWKMYNITSGLVYPDKDAYNDSQRIIKMRLEALPPSAFREVELRKIQARERGYSETYIWMNNRLINIDQMGDGPHQSYQNSTNSTLLNTSNIPDNSTISFTGDSANNSIKGNSNDNIIMGESGGDNLYGFEGNDIIVGGKGSDVLIGSVGNDTYIYYKGDDGDVIKDIAGDQDTLEIHGIPDTDITYEVSGDYGQHLIINFATENEEDKDTQYIIIEDFFTKDGSYTTRSIENIILKNEGQADDTINVLTDIVNPFLSAAKLFNTTPDEKINDKGTDDTFVGFRGNDIINGLRGNDTLDGGYGDDTLTGGEGDDMLYGGTGNDTYHYVYDQDGSDVISDRGYNHSNTGDKLIISGIDPAETDAVKLEVRGDNSEHLLITFKNDETIFIQDYFKASPTDDPNENTCVEEIYFEGFATTWTKTTVEQKLAALNQNFGHSSDDEPVYGTRGNNIMQGGHGDNTLNGGAGDDTLYAGFQNPNIVRIGASVNMLNGGYGKDTYIYNKGDGICVIEDEDLKSNNDSLDTLIINGVIPKYVAPAPSNSPSPSGPSLLPPPDDGGGGGFGEPDPIDPFDGEDLGPYVPPPPDPPPEVIVEAPITWLQSKMLFLTAGENSEHLVLYFGRDNYIMIKNYFYERAPDDESTEPEKSYRVENIVFKALQADGTYATEYELSYETVYGLVAQGQAYGTSDITFYNDTLYGTMGADLITGGAGEDTLEGGRDNDTIYGGDFADTIYGGEGDDILWGEQGDDKLYGGRGNDTIYGGDGYDTIDGGEGDDEVLGGKGNDTIDGGKGDDVIYGNDGDDQLTGGLGNDTLEGGAGDDTLAGGIGDDIYTYRMGEGHDTIAEAGGATDTLKLYGIDPNDIIFHVVGKTLIMEFDEKNSLTLDNYFHTESYDDTVVNCQIDTIEFYTADGVLTTTWNTAQTYGSDGWKTNELWTRAREQQPNGVTGSRGNDHLEGTSGTDTLNGGYGHDRIKGNDGNDTITGGKGTDILEGGAGEDTYIFAKGDGHDTIIDASAVNTLKLEDFTKEDLVFIKQHVTVLAEPLEDGTTGYINGKASKDKELAARNDLIIKVGESDAITIKDFFNSDGTVKTTAGISTVLLKSGVTLDRNAIAAALGLVTPTAITGTTYTFSPNSLRELYEMSAFEFAKISLGTISKNDVRFFRGTSKAKTDNEAKTENDLVLRFSTAKQLIVRDFFSPTTTATPNKVKQFVFSDGIFSSEYVNNAYERYVSFDNLEDDVLDGNFADDILYGGFGNDTIAGAAGNDELYGEEGNDTITGGTGEDKLYGGKGHDSLSGNEDDDTLYGGTGNDTISGGKGIDTLNGDEGDDTLSGDEGNDILFGGIGKDTLSGGIGDDILEGGTDDDVLMGGKGDDTYRYNVGDGNDIIRDARLIKAGEAAGIHENRVNIFGVTDMASVSARAQGYDLVLEFTLADNKKETLTLENFFYTHDATDEEKYDYRISEIRFYETRTSTSALQVWGNNATNSTEHYYKIDEKLAAFTNVATDYDDVIIGNAANNTISGGKGSDKIMGYDGDDVLHGNQGNDLLFGGKGNDIINGGFENDLLYGEEGNDTLNGGVDDDILIGGKGDDTYIYQLGHGHDIIRESVSYKKEGETNDSEEDTLKIYGVSDINNVTFEIKGNDLRIVFDADNSITLEGYFFTNKTTDTFLTDARVEFIKFYSGMTQSEVPIATFTYQDICDTLSPTNGVLDSNAVNTIRTSSATDHAIMQGAGGNDEYTYTRGHKMITVYDRSAALLGSTECDTLVLNDIRDTEVAFVRDGAHLIVRYKVDATTYADAVKLYNYYLDIDKDSESINTKIEQIQFKWTEYIYVVNGTTLQTPIPDPKSLTWNKSTVEEKIRYISYNSPKTTEQYGTFGNDVIVGNVGADTIEGAKGDDEISGGTGDDKIYGGEGNDTISGNEGDDTISGGEGDDKIWGNADNDTLSGGDGIDELYGGVGNDTLYGGKDNDKLTGGKGNDTLDGGSGSDIYYYTKGDGNDVIRDSGYSKDVDKLVLKDIAPSEVILSVVGDENCDLRIEIIGADQNKANEYIILEDYFKKGQATRIEEIRFGSATGTLWDYETVYAMMLSDVVRSNKLLVDTSNANNYTFDTTEVFGNFGNDTLSNSKGDDIMYGGIGADTYIYTYKDATGKVIGGQDWILNNGDARKDDTLIIKGFDPTHAVFEMSGENSENLVIKFGTVKGNFNPSYFRDLDQMTREHSVGIQNYFSADERFRVNKIVFEYTVGAQTVTRTMEYSDIYKMFYVDKATDALLNNTGNNVLHGKNPYAILDGGTGDDMLVAGLNTMAMLGGSGNDTYVYHYGDGKVWIKDEQGTADKLILNTISGKNATMYTIGNHAVMYFDESNYVVIENHNLAAHKLEQIEQRVSSVVAPTTLLNMEIDSFEYSQLKFDMVQEGSQIRYSKGMGRVVVNAADYTKADTRLFISGYAASELKYYQIKRTDNCGGGSDPMTGEALPWTQEVTNFHLLIKFDDTNYILLKDYYRVAARNDIFRLTPASGTQITQNSTSLPTYLVNELSVGTSVNGSDPVQAFIKGTTSGDIINDTAGNNSIYTMTGNDTVHLNTGDDIVYSDNGAKTYTYHFTGTQKDGRDWIITHDTGNGDLVATDDVLNLVGVNKNKVTIETSGAQHEHLILRFDENNFIGLYNYFIRGTGETDAEQFKYMFKTIACDDGMLDQSEFESVRLKNLLTERGKADGNTKTIMGTHLGDILTGVSGEEYISGGAGDDIINGGRIQKGGYGNDIMKNGSQAFGGVGDDIYESTTCFDYEGGSDTYITSFKVYNSNLIPDELVGCTSITDKGDSQEVDRLILKGVKRDNVSFEKHGSHLLVRITQTGVRINDYFAQDRKSLIEEIIFESGEILRYDDIIKSISASAESYGDPNSKTSQFVVGTTGNNTISGGFGDDVLMGGKGNDTLKGGEGNDTYVFNRGDGNDLIIESGKENYYGNKDVIVFGDGILPNDILIARSGNSVILSIKGTDDAITIFDCLAPISSSNSAFTTEYRIEEIQFNNGTVWNFKHLVENITEYWGSVNPDTIDANLLTGFGIDNIIDAREGHDTIYGREGNDTLIGGKGNDKLYGGAGNDTYIFNLGDGQDTVLDDGGNDYDTIRIASSIHRNNARFSRSGDNGEHLQITFANSEDKITVQNFFHAALRSKYSIERIIFDSNGEEITAEQLYQMPMSFYTKPEYLSGRNFSLEGFTGAYKSVITGDEYENILEGSKGDDVFIGLQGEDTYVFRKGFGKDVIYDTTTPDYIALDPTQPIVLAQTNDTVRFIGYASEHAILSREGDDLKIKFFDADDELTIQEYFVVSNRYENKIETIIFENNGQSIVWNTDTITANLNKYNFVTPGGVVSTTKSNYVDGQGGSYHVNGHDQADILDGKDGNDVLNGGVGNDTYIFGRGYGNDIVVDADTAGFDTLLLKGLLPKDIVCYQTGNDLTIKIIETGETVSLQNFYNATTQYRIENIKFSDNTTWSTATLLTKIDTVVTGTSASETIDITGNTPVSNRYYVKGEAGNDILKGSNFNDVLEGGSGDDTLHGRDGDDYLIGGAGGDVMYGGAGDDTYVFRRGDGVDYLQDASGYDRLIMSGIKSTDVILESNPGNRWSPRLRLKDTDESITLSWYLYNSSTIVEEILFSDGIVWKKEDIEAMLFQEYFGTSQGDTIDFSTKPNIDKVYKVNGQAGNDTIIGSNQENYLIGGDGNDELHGGSNRDILEGSAGSDILNGNAEADKLFGGDGDDVLNGGAGNDRLEGGSGDDVYDGGTGNDTLYDYQTGVTTGNDTYIFNRGYGQDTIIDGNSPNDKLIFGNDITTNDIEVIQSGNNLILKIKNSTDQITISDYLNSNADISAQYRIEQIVFADGTIWTYQTIQAMLTPAPVLSMSTTASINNQVDQLIHAMAGFGSPEGMMSPSQNDMAGKKDGYIPLVAPSDVHSVRNTLS